MHVGEGHLERLLGVVVRGVGAVNVRQVVQWKTRRGRAEGEVMQGGGIVGDVGREEEVDMMLGGEDVEMK